MFTWGFVRSNFSFAIGLLSGGGLGGRGGGADGRRRWVELLLGSGGRTRTDDPSIMSRVLLPTELRRPDHRRSPDGSRRWLEPPDRIELSTFSLPWKRSAD